MVSPIMGGLMHCREILMFKNTNIKTANPNDFVTIGRMKGNIKVGDKIYKMSSKQLTTLAYSSFENDIQTKKIPLNCEIKIVKNYLKIILSG